MRLSFGLAAAALLCGGAYGANESVYTKLNSPAVRCKTLEQNVDEGGWIVEECPGHGGIKVYVAESDLRMSVGYGWNGRAERAMSQSFPAFNHVGENLEWRLKGGKPVATILRWHIDGGPDMPKGDVLVVTQLEEGNQCWIAMVSANKNKNANELARQAADELTGTVTCTEDSMAKIYGVPDPAIMPTN